MATSKVNLRQTAVNAAASMTSASLAGGLIDADAALEAFKSTQEEVFQILLLDFDPAVDNQSNNGGGNRGTKNFSSEEGGSLKLNSGKFKNSTIAEVHAMDKAAVDKFGYKGDDGASYIEWLGTDANKNDFTRRAAAAFLEGLRSTSE